MGRLNLKGAGNFAIDATLRKVKKTPMRMQLLGKYKQISGTVLSFLLLLVTFCSFPLHFVDFRLRVLLSTPLHCTLLTSVYVFYFLLHSNKLC